MATVPTVPLIVVRPKCTNQTLEFYWRPPTSDGGSAITGYTLTDGTLTYNITGNPGYYKITGLTNGQIYSFTLAAVNGIGTGPAASFRSVQPGDKPQPPASVAYTDQGSGNVLVNWTTPANIGGTTNLLGMIVRAYRVDTNANVNLSSQSTLVSVPGGVANASYIYPFYNLEMTDWRFQVQLQNDPGRTLRTVGFTSTFSFSAFSPNFVSGMQLWLEATNSANFTLSSSYISTWTDRSANSYKVSQTTQSNFALFSTNFVAFSSFQYLNLPQAAINNASTWTIMFYFVPKDTYAWITAKQHDANNTYNVISYAATTNSNGTVTSGISTTLYLHTSNAGSTITYPVGFSTNSVNLVRMQYDAQSNLTLWNNGFLWSTVKGDFRLGNVTGATNATLGALIQSNAFQSPSTGSFQLGTMLFFSTILSASTLYKLEGYLAYTYGLQSTLPVNHPYYLTVPTLLDTQLNFSPSSISSLQLWLDAADGTRISTTGSASSIARWFDKSGNARDATPNVGRPFYSNTALTGNLPGVVFEPASSLTVTAPSQTFRSSVHMFVVFQKTGAANANECVITRTSGNLAAPFDPYNTTRYFGNGGTTGNFTSAFNLQTATAVNVWSYLVTSNIAQDFWQGSTVNQFIGATNYGDTVNNILFGVRADGVTNFRGVLSESLFYSSTITFGERQAVEGYLAWKWGAQSSLIIDHPFRFQPPTLRSLYEGSNGAFLVPNSGQSTLVVLRDNDIQLDSGDFTIEWWQRPTSFTSSDLPWLYGVFPSGNLFMYCLATNYMRLQATSVNCDFYLPSTIQTLSNQWHHVAVVKSTNVTRVFYDGMESRSTTTAFSSIASTFNLHVATYKGWLGDFHIVKNNVLYSNNFSPPSSIQSNVSTALLLKPTTRGRCMIDKGPLKKNVLNFQPVDWTPNIYPDFVQSFGTIYTPSSNNYVQTGMDNDLRLRTGDFTIEFYANPPGCNARPWGLSRYATGLYFDCELASNNNASEISFRWDNTFPPAFNNGWLCPRRITLAWNHYAITRQISTIRVFQNGILLSTSKTSAFDFNPTTEVWTIGGQSNQPSYGYLTNFHMVKGVALYTSSFTPPSIPIQSNVSTVLLLNFASTLTVDSGPLNKALTQVGTPSWYYATKTIR